MLNFLRPKVEKHEHPQGRKQISENRLADIGIRYNPNLPVTYENDSVNIRTPQEIASRIICLWEVVNNANGSKQASKKLSCNFLKDVGLWNNLSPLEQKFLSNSKTNPQQIIDFTWRTEVLKVLYWVLKEIETLGKPIEDKNIYDVNDETIKKFPSIESFLNTTTLRPTKEILDEADFTYRLHWCSREHRRKKQGVPKKYNYSVIKERDFAFSWLTNPSIRWDEISLDT